MSDLGQLILQAAYPFNQADTGLELTIFEKFTVVTDLILKLIKCLLLIRPNSIELGNLLLIFN